MDYYSILGVPKNASQEDIKKAYRRLASKHHPDRGGDTAMFQQIQAAYDVIGDTQKRQQYDNPAPQGFSNPGGPHFNFGGGHIDINDIFAQMFGQHRQAHNQVFRTQISVSLLDAYKGTTHILQLQTQQGPKYITIEIPAGVKTGDQIRYDHIVENGVLVVEFVVPIDLKFERKGNDLYCNHSISVLDLIVGTSFEFHTISGKIVQVNVKPKTQPHMQLKLPGYGMPITRTSQYGDQIILLKPFIPDNISDDILRTIERCK